MPETFYTFTQGVDANGNVFNYGDEKERADIAKLKPDNIPVGTRIVSATPLQPQTLYGGTWVEESYHNFNGDYVYTKLSNAEATTPATPETNGGSNDSE